MKTPFELDTTKTGRIIKIYETLSDYDDERELIKKGIALDDLDHYMRSVIKYDSKQDILENIEIKDKIQKELLYDLIDQVTDFYRKKMCEFMD